jgi:hypothetical protein
MVVVCGSRLQGSAFGVIGANRRSFDLVTRDGAARDFSQDDTVYQS